VPEREELNGSCRTQRHGGGRTQGAYSSLGTDVTKGLEKGSPDGRRGLRLVALTVISGARPWRLRRSQGCHATTAPSASGRPRFRASQLAGNDRRSWFVRPRPGDAGQPDRSSEGVRQDVQRVPGRIYHQTLEIVRPPTHRRPQDRDRGRQLRLTSSARLVSALGTASRGSSVISPRRHEVQLRHSRFPVGDA